MERDSNCFYRNIRCSSLTMRHSTVVFPFWPASENSQPPEGDGFRKRQRMHFDACVTAQCIFLFTISFYFSHFFFFCVLLSKKVFLFRFLLHLHFMVLFIATLVPLFSPLSSPSLHPVAVNQL